MAQIAQQDHLVIEIAGALAAMDANTKNKLIECIKVGTIMDVVVISVEEANKKNYGKVLGYSVDSTAPAAPKYSVAIMEVEGGTPEKVALN